MIVAANDLRQIVVWAAKLLYEGIEKFKNKNLKKESLSETRQIIVNTMLIPQNIKA